jgi:hypothetical protein
MFDQYPDSDADREAVVQGRRRLLRAAAAGVPLIATLPNGAAWATASTSECIIQSVQQSKTALQVAPSPDGFVRLAGWEVVFEKLGPPPKEQVTVYSMTTSSNGKVDGPYYYPSGAIFEPDSNNAHHNKYKRLSSKKCYLMRMFQPTPNGTEPISLENCSSSSSIKPQCIYPVAKVGASIPGGGETVGALGSCFCSLNPGATGC